MNINLYHAITALNSASTEIASISWAKTVQSENIHALSLKRARKEIEQASILLDQFEAGEK